jgi:hypothetical protein
MTDLSNTTNLSNTINTGLGTIASDSYEYINNTLSDPKVMVLLVLIILIYIVIFMYLGENTSNSLSDSENVSNSSANIIGVIIVSIFIILVAINGLQYFFGVDIVASIKNVFSKNPEIEITVDTSHIKEETETPELDIAMDMSHLKTEKTSVSVPEILLKPQVFNIPKNDYVYADAQALCSAYGSRLATYQEMEDAYENGGEWCNYGWSEGQMALFPTQQKTYDTLQKIEGHENDCGRPGVNGGYISNPAIRFGVNCFGYKPRMTPEEEDIMATRPIYPKTEKDKAIEDRVKYWKDKLNEIIVSPFNHNTWSRL